MVVSVIRKRPGVGSGQVWIMETNNPEPLMRSRKSKDAVKTGTYFHTRISSENLFTVRAAAGIKVA